jgi:hypothetical protein
MMLLMPLLISPIGRLNMVAGWVFALASYACAIAAALLGDRVKRLYPRILVSGCAVTLLLAASYILVEHQAIWAAFVGSAVCVILLATLPPPGEPELP